MTSNTPRSPQPIEGSASLDFPVTVAYRVVYNKVTGLQKFNAFDLVTLTTSMHMAVKQANFIQWINERVMCFMGESHCYTTLK